MAAPAVFATLPSTSLFHFPPGPDPFFIPPPLPGTTAAAPPFFIPDHIYTAVLDARVPITIATVYAITAKLLNRYNRSTGRRPWAISRTRAFFVFVVLHNVFLAIYSAWTFWGMFGTLRRGIVNPFASTVDSTGRLRSGGWAATADSFCRLNGPPGLGNGLFYNEATGAWQTSSSDALTGSPDRAQPGRVWNEGLAFYGWIFYLSKFYEVLDTFIILAKGKFSSTLQTYHHAGAMMCMWAGMRYMTAPIWVFAFVNSGIHALMYTYYTITAFSFRVPTIIKRSLTTLQICQFLVGASYAMVHSFVSYSVPVIDSASDSPVIVGSVPSSVAEEAQTNNSTLSAAGDDIVATKVVPCIPTTGETFAIWLNVLYLAPLTYLFVKFFITSYLRRSSAQSVRAPRVGKPTSASHLNGNPTLANTIVTTANAAAAAEALMRRRLSNVGNLAEKAGWDAALGLEKEVYGESQEEAIADDLSASAPASSRSTRKGRSSRRAA